MSRMGTPAEEVGGMILAGLRRYQLKRVYATPSLWEAREILALLEQQRIPVTLLNEHSAGTPGVLPFNARMAVDAEVWVLDASLAPRCERLIAEYLAALERDPAVDESGSGQDRTGNISWRCPSCGEKSPASFELCWSCGQGRPHS
ncbi:MAG: DUF2007 domain-containing protein [Gammaproteobacteria bacterium]